MDDEAVVVAVVRTTLENYGYRVLAAENGLEAVATLSKNRDTVNLVITGLDMPLMGGGMPQTAALRRIRPDLKVIVAGGSEKELEGVKGLQINGFIPKPITVGKLLTTIHDLMAGNGK